MNPRVLYVGGAGRSGSTVLADLLGRYERFVSVGEVRYLWDRGLTQNQLCGCRAPFRDCPFWTDVITDAFGGLSAVDGTEVMALARDVDRVRFVPAVAHPRLRRPRFTRAFDRYGDFVSRLYRSIANVSGAAVVVDSSKDPSYAFVLEALPAIDLSVAHLVRDSRAVAYSWTRARVRPEVHWTVEYMARRKPLRTAVVWAANNALLEELGRGHPRFLRLRYEDFVAHPDDSLAALAALPGGTTAQPASRSEGRSGQQASRSEGRSGQQAPADGVGFAHTVSGNPSRFDGGPVRISLDDEWRQRLPARDRLVVTVATAPLLARYGYLGGD